MQIPQEYATIVARHQETFPVDVLGIAKDMNINVFESDTFKDTQSGIIGMNDDNSVFIVVNRKHAPTRQMFTIAHELGHYMKHKGELERQEIPMAGITRVLRREDREMSPAERKIEAEANDLAAEILMPENAFRAAWEENEGSVDVLERVATKFGVSPAAANVRASRVLQEYVV